jgi:hypothetical protein
MVTLCGTIIVIVVFVMLIERYNVEDVFQDNVLWMGLFLILCLCADWFIWWHSRIGLF